MAPSHTVSTGPPARMYLHAESDSSLLYLLESAALLAFPTDGTGADPLPHLAAAQARTFLRQVVQREQSLSVSQPALMSKTFRPRYPVDDSPSGAASSSSVPATDVATTGSLAGALSRLPEYWRQHNPLCPTCGALLVPGLNASLPRKRKPAASRAPASLRCRLCLSTGHRSEADVADDAAKMKVSKARFPMVRARGRKPPPNAPTNSPMKAEQSKQSAVPLEIRRPEPLHQDDLLRLQRPLKRMKAGSAVESENSARADERWQRLPVTETAPSPVPAPLPKPITTPAPVSPSPCLPAQRDVESNNKQPKSKPPTARGPTSKQDHKAALRALLSSSGGGGGATGGTGAKGNRKKTGGGAVANPPTGSDSGPPSAGGGLKDFLAGL